MHFINSEIEEYCLEFSSKEHKLLEKLSRETNHKIMMPRMMSSHYMGLLLKLITSLKKPNKILEIGMFTAYSTICLALFCHHFVIVLQSFCHHFAFILQSF